MKITTRRLIKIACLLYDIKKDEIANIYTYDENTYIVSLHDGKAVMMIFKEGKFKMTF